VAMLVQKGLVVWFTGLPCSGKTTITIELQSLLRKMNLLTYILDGYQIRKELNSELGFSEEDRDENISEKLKEKALKIHSALISKRRKIIYLKNILCHERYNPYFINEVDMWDSKDLRSIFRCIANSNLKSSISNCRTGLHNFSKPIHREA